MNSINLYDANSNLIIEFKSFKFLNQGLPEFVEFTLEINFEFFHVKNIFEAEVLSFIEMKERLLRLDNIKWDIYIFQQLDNSISIQAEKQSEEHIKIIVTVANAEFTGELKFFFFTNKLFISKLINEIDNIFI
jgi:hypothetical protein